MARCVRDIPRIAPAQILRFRRAHPGIAHNEHKIVSDRAAPVVSGKARLLGPSPREGEACGTPRGELLHGPWPGGAFPAQLERGSRRSSRARE